MSYGRDLADGDETLFVDQFSNRNYLDVAIHESGIIGVVQDENEQDDDNENENRKTNEYPQNPHGIALDPVVAHGEIAEVPPENPVELTGVAQLENEVDDNVVPPLLTSEYKNNYESDNQDQDTDTSTKQHQSIIHQEDMPPMVMNV